MQVSPRIDLDGITLRDPDGPSAAVAVLRRRTLEGLVLSMPESADILVPWDEIDHADIDLARGTVTIGFSPEFASRANWLGGLCTLTGTWIDRFTLRSGSGR